MRDVVLVGPAGSGKTTLARALLAAAGAPPLDDAGPGRLAYGVFGSGAERVCLLDPPGDPELGGELAAGLRAASSAVFVLSPVQGVDPRTTALWSACEAAGLPRLVVLTQLDRPGADADEAVAVCRRVLGDGVVPLQLPLHDDDGAVGGLLDLLTLRVSDLSAGTPVQRAADPQHRTLVEGLRGELLEAVLSGSEDEELFERWLGGEEPDAGTLSRELGAAVARGDVQPAVVASPTRGVGVAELVELLAHALPDATARPCPAVSLSDGSPAAPLVPEPEVRPVAEVVRGGSPALLRVWAGSLVPGAAAELDGQALVLSVPAGPGEVCALPLGDLAVQALPRSVLAGPGEPLVLEPWAAPVAMFPVGVAPDDGLAGRVAGDPVARLAQEDRTGQLLLWSLGPRHAELLLAGLPSAPVVVPPGARPVPVEVRVPSWSTGTVRSDLAGRGGRVLAAHPDLEADVDTVVLDVELPARELPGYALALARGTASTGTFTRPPS